MSNPDLTPQQRKHLDDWRRALSEIVRRVRAAGLDSRGIYSVLFDFDKRFTAVKAKDPRDDKALERIVLDVAVDAARAGEVSFPIMHAGIVAEYLELAKDAETAITGTPELMSVWIADFAIEVCEHAKRQQK